MKSMHDALDRLLNPGGLGRSRPASRSIGANYRVIDDVLTPKQAFAHCRQLERSIYPRMQPLVARIPRSTIYGMTESYAETLPKTMRMKTAYLASPRSREYRVAADIGVIGLLKGDQLRRLAERMTQTLLEPDPDCQIICYEHGDFSGPHNDHHPDAGYARRGFVDVHITLSNPQVRSQLLVIERHGLLTDATEIAVPCAISFYRLPFWHYTTPLLAQRGQEGRARRWLLLASYDIATRRRSRARR